MNRSKILWFMAREGIKRHRELYVPFRILLGLTFFISGLLSCLAHEPSIIASPYVSHMQLLLWFSLYVNTFFMTLFIGGLCRRLVRYRQEEYATWLVLGLTHRELLGVGIREILLLFVQTFFASLFALLILYCLSVMAFVRFIAIDVPLIFFPKPLGIFVMVIVCIILCVTSLLSIVRPLRKQNTRRMLFEKTEKSTTLPLIFLYSLGGILLLAIGYLLAISTKSPLKSMPILFLASTSVIVGTYGLFKGLIPLFLRILQRLPIHHGAIFYVRTALLRSTIQRESTGLASICVTTCGALLLLICSSTLFHGMDNAVTSRYPHEINYTLVNTHGLDEKASLLSSFLHAHRSELSEITFKKFSIMEGHWENNTFVPLGASDSNESSSSVDAAETMDIFHVSSDFEQPNLEQFQTTNDALLQGAKFQDRAIPKEIISSEPLPWSEFQTFYRSESTLSVPLDEYPLYAHSNENLLFSIEPKDPMKGKDLMGELGHLLGDENSVVSKSAVYHEFLGLFGGIFFVGILLAVSYVAATAANIYYKQLLDTEEAKKRFNTMWRVGMSPEFIAKVNASQARRSAFLPLIFAFLHILVASVLLRRMLMLLGLANPVVFYTALGITYLCFSIFYILCFTTSVSIANRHLLRTMTEPM